MRRQPKKCFRCFIEGAAQVFVSSQSNAVNGCRLAKLNNKGDVSALTIAIRGQLRSGRVGRMPSERGLRVFDYKKKFIYHLLSIIYYLFSPDSLRQIQHFSNPFSAQIAFFYKKICEFQIKAVPLRAFSGSNGGTPVPNAPKKHSINKLNN